ncbi:Sulfotransferase [Ostreococcus tauri]|uniref:Sulfotransferase n=1 Tax=Ostreococcus tauri TaxID=70448 RepID=Q01GF3_OSTTA|nr:Sulfotransferase [Ostreococcus tauri]CAL50191.1 Sulfotransferase [Ostreococcus tauri]|eukprot:XP_003074340.1 Sulfotransferase [Ostreococcus tauri]
MARDVESAALLDASTSEATSDRRTKCFSFARVGSAALTLALGVAACAGQALNERSRSESGRLASGLGEAAIVGTSVEKTLRSASCVWRLERAEAENARCDPMGTDVVVVPSLRAVYVDVTKAASESIRKRLTDAFQATWTDEKYVLKSSGLGRSTTASLPDEVLDTYKFFTFVRNPSERFLSGYRQAFCRSMCQGCERGMSPTRPPTIEQTIDLLEILRSKASGSVEFCSHRRGESMRDRDFLTNPWLDEHLESIIYRLSGVTKRGTHTPIHFIGRVETLNEDWGRLMDELGVDTNHPARAPLEHVEHECSIAGREEFLSAQSALFYSHLLKGKRAPTKGELFEPVRVMYDREGNPVEIPTPSVKLGAYVNRLKALYEDDFRCLGYAS